MFVEINGLAYNLMFAQSIDKLDEDGKYKILYAISNENKLVEEFDNEADRDAKYEKAQAAGGASKEEIEHIEDEIEHLKEVGFHPLKVDELPTEDIKDYILYLVPSDKPDENNLCYEYLYINDAWEMVGTTSVDLSNYYTKDVIDEKIKIDVLDIGTFSGATITDADTLAKGSEIITSYKKLYTDKKGASGGTLLLRIKTGFAEEARVRILTNSVSDFNLKFSEYTFKGLCLNGDKIGVGFGVRFNGNWSGDTFTCTSIVPIRGTSYSLNDYLSKTNTTSYTPTANYHPATKKYVDDSLANIDLSKVTGFINLHNNSSNNPLVLSTLESGMYIVSNDTWSGTSLTMVARPGDRSTTVFDFDLSRFACLFIETKIPEVYDNVRRSAYLSMRDADKLGVYILYDDGYSLTKEWHLSKELLNTSTSQTISGTKTFSTIPKQSDTTAPTQDTQFTNKKYVDDNKGQTIQYSTMPTASASTVGKIVQYTGTTDNTYTNGYFYIGISTTETVDNEEVTTYSWEQIDVQPSGPIGINKYEINITTDCVNTTDSGSRYFNATDKQSFEDFIIWAGNQTEDFYLQINLVNQPVGNITVPTTSWNGIPGSSRSNDFYNVVTKKYVAGTNVSEFSIPFVLTGYANGTFVQDSDRTRRGQAYGSITTVNMYYRTGVNYSGVSVCNDFYGHAVFMQYINRYALGLSNTTEFTPTSDYHPATKKYVDSQIIPKYIWQGGSTQEDLDMFQAWYDEFLETGNLQTIVYKRDGIASDKWMFPIYLEVTKGTSFWHRIVFGSVGDQANLYIPPEFDFVTVGIKMQEQGDKLVVSNIQINNSVQTYIAVPYTNQPGDQYYKQRSGVLTVDNTYAYTPTSDYHPSTKKYVDDKIASAITDALGGSY